MKFGTRRFWREVNLVQNIAERVWWKDQLLLPLYRYAVRRKSLLALKFLELTADNILTHGIAIPGTRPWQGIPEMKHVGGGCRGMMNWGNWTPCYDRACTDPRCIQDRQHDPTGWAILHVREEEGAKDGLCVLEGEY